MTVLSIRELGGAVTVPYTVDESGQIYIGLVREYRPTMGEESTLNVPRGMAELNEEHMATAERELNEETGYDTRKSVKRVIELASGLNANSALFDNSQTHTKGISIYGVEIDTAKLSLGHDKDGSIFYAFPEDTTNATHPDATEKIYGSKFVPLNEALESKDMFTVVSVSLLLGQLLSDGEYIVPQKSTYRSLD